MPPYSACLPTGRFHFMRRHGVVCRDVICHWVASRVSISNKADTDDELSLAWRNSQLNNGIQILISLLFLVFGLQPIQANSASQGESDSSTALILNKWTIHLSYVAGYKHLEDSWAPAQHEAEFGLIDFDFGKESWPMSLCIQLLLSYSPVVPRLQGLLGDYSGTYECNLGIRKVFRPDGRIQPHMAAGVGILGTSTTTRIDRGVYYQEENSSALGYWGNVGLYWIFSETNLAGLAVEYSNGRITLSGQRLNAGGTHVLCYFGWHW